MLQAIIQPLLEARATIVRQVLVIDRRIITAAQDDPVCSLLMTIPGVVTLADRRRSFRPHAPAVQFR